LTLLQALIAATSVVTVVISVFSFKTRSSVQDRLRKMVPGSGLNVALSTSKRRKLMRLSKTSQRQIESELADLIDLACSAVLTGLSLHSAIERVATRASGIVASELRVFLRNVKMGHSLSLELDALCERLPTPSVREFVSKISIAIARGTPLAESLASLSTSLRERRSLELLARAGANETKMLIPLVALVLPTTVLFALYPSVLVLNVGFN
jgi:tight adherence protein C